MTDEHITQDYDRMYWPNGQKIIAAARIVARNPNLHAVYMGNFRCGPDSFISHFVPEEMKGKPFLQIEVDEHSADAGMITRYEAFLDSLKGSRVAKRASKQVHIPKKSATSPMMGRTLFFPYMNDGAYTIAATCRSFGIHSEVSAHANARRPGTGEKIYFFEGVLPYDLYNRKFFEKAYGTRYRSIKSQLFYARS